MYLKSLFDKKSTFGSIYITLIVNRIQMLYFVFILPSFLIHPYMIWILLIMGILSHFNLMILSKWFVSGYAAKGYQGFVKLLGERTVRILTLIGLLPILLKIIIITLSYAESVYQFIFPSMSISWLIFFTFLLSCYVAAHGMENTIRFVVIVFLFTFWMSFLFFKFYTPPIASLHDLYPIIPTEWSIHSWRAVLSIWSALSGPEYLICLTPWLSSNPKVFKYLAVGNALTTIEFLTIFIASLFFFGSNYLTTTSYPVVNMVRFLQSPLFERVDMILLSVHMFHFVFVISILVLCFYGGTRIFLKRTSKQTSPFGFISSCITIFVLMYILHKWFWTPGVQENVWLTFELWSGVLTYTLVPIFLLIATKRKGRIQ